MSDTTHPSHPARQVIQVTAAVAGYQFIRGATPALEVLGRAKNLVAAGRYTQARLVAIEAGKCDAAAILPGLLITRIAETLGGDCPDEYCPAFSKHYGDPGTCEEHSATAVPMLSGQGCCPDCGKVTAVGAGKVAQL